MSRQHFMVALGIAGIATLAVPAVAAAQGRFHGLDRNRDGAITRAEWRGSDTSFRQHDRNRDGVISGVEVRAVPAWDARNNRWERDTGKARGKAAAKGKATAHGKAKAKPSKSVKSKGRGGR